MEQLNESQMEALFNDGRISQKELHHYQNSTSRSDKNLANNSIWDNLYSEVSRDARKESLDNLMREARQELALSIYRD